MDHKERLQRCQAGDELAWEVLVREHQGRVCAIAYGYVGEHDEAMDLAQEIFVRVYNSLDTCTDPEKFESWLTRIAINTCLDLIRRQKREGLRVVGPDDDGDLDLLLAGRTGPDADHEALTRLYRNEGNLTFTNVTAEVLPGIGQLASAGWGDFDQDGDQDYVVVLAADRRVELLFNAGDGSVAGSSSLDLGSVANVEAGDLDGDGAADLLVAIDGNNMSAPQNRVLYQQAGGTFSPGQTFGASPVTALVPGDIDADGWPDIVAINEAGVHQVYLGSQGGNFSLAPEQIYSTGMQRGVLTDFNNDGSLDLILAGSAAGVVKLSLAGAQSSPALLLAKAR